MSEIKVSIICLTYNHEKYICSALEGFVSQKTDFSYEVIVHDDASTDRTAEIIREYEQKYPSIIRPIYQTDNQYSKGIAIVLDIIIPVARGKYIAFCEGDDYWIDDKKLQKQVDFLENHADYVSCYTANLYIEAESEKLLFVSQRSPKSERISTEDCIMSKELPHTSTLVMRKDVLENMPQFARGLPVGDIVYFAWNGISGKVYYMSDITSKYRVSVAGSWTNRMKNNTSMQDNHSTKMFKFYSDLDKYTDYRYHSAVQYKKDSYLLYQQRKNRDILAVLANEVYKKARLRQKLAWIMETMMPNVIEKYRYLRYGREHNE